MVRNSAQLQGGIIMASSSQQTGMQGVYLVAAELSQKGYVVSPTSRSAAGADLLVTDQSCNRAFSVQVKTNAKTFSFWLLSKKASEIISDTHIYILVNLRKSGSEKEFFILPSKVIAKKIYKSKSRTGSVWYSISYKDIEKYRDNWSVFGAPK